MFLIWSLFVIFAYFMTDENSIMNRRCVQLKTWFDYRNHVCIVSSSSLFKQIFLLRENGDEVILYQRTLY